MSKTAENKDKQEQIIPTGFPELDKELAGGIHQNDLVLIGYRPGNSFWWFQSHLILNAAKRFQERKKKEFVLVFSLNFCAKEIGEQLSRLNPLWMKDHNIHIVETAPLATPDEIREYIDFLEKEYKAKAGLIIINHLGFITDENNYYETDGSVLFPLKIIASEKNTPIVVSHILPRDVECHEEINYFPPRFTFFRAIRKELYHPDIILTLHRPDFYKKVGKTNEDFDNSLRVQCHKNDYGYKFLCDIDCDDKEFV